MSWYVEAHCQDHHFQVLYPFGLGHETGTPKPRQKARRGAELRHGFSWSESAARTSRNCIDLSQHQDPAPAHWLHSIHYRSRPELATTEGESLCVHSWMTQQPVLRQTNTLLQFLFPVIPQTHTQTTPCYPCSDGNWDEKFWYQKKSLVPNYQWEICHLLLSLNFAQSENHDLPERVSHAPDWQSSATPHPLLRQFLDADQKYRVSHSDHSRGRIAPIQLETHGHYR